MDTLHGQTTDFLPSQVNLFLIFILRKFRFSLRSSPSSPRPRRADGSNSKASLTRRLAICLKRSAAAFSSFIIEICLQRTLNHSGLEKRWITVKEHKSKSRGDMDGSWVDMNTRTP